MSFSRRLGPFVLFAFGVGVGCQKTNDPAPKTAGGMLAGPTVCVPGEKFADPLVVDWKPLDRGDLEIVMKQGIAIVEYDCDHMKLLKNCHANGSYGFVGMNRKQQVIRLETAEELKANLPTLGATFVGKIGAEMQAGSVLDIALVVVGKRATLRSNVTRVDLQGACDGATHYVTAATVGAFAFDRGTRSKLRSVADVFGATASGEVSSGSSLNDRDGELAACSKASADATSAPDQCSAVVRVDLAPLAVGGQPISAVAAATSCPAGMVLSAGKCTKSSVGELHTCQPDDVVDCQEQCKKGDAASCHRFGIALMTGKGVSLDRPKGMSELQRACEKDVPLACDYLAWNLLRGPEEVRNPNAAAPWFEKACSAAVLSSCNGLAIVYQYGVGVPKDGPRAESLYRKACDGAEPSACNNLGGMYREGVGIPRDDAKALATYERACSLNIDDGCACSFAGDHYVTGRGTAADATKGIALLKRGCAKGYKFGCQRLAELGQQP